MPINFPPGSPNNVSVTPVPLQVFTPTPSVQASVRVFNPGSSVVYVGGVNVSPVNGLPVLPGNRPIDLQNVNVNVYACSGVSSVAATSTLTAAVVAAGATSFTLGSATLNATGPGYLRVGNGNAVEYVSYSTINSSSVATLTSATLYDHAASATVATVNATPGPLVVQAGVL